EAVVSTPCVSVLAATSIVTWIGERARGRGRSPGRSALRRYAIGERVRVKIGVITQTVPRTIFLGCLADAVFLACCIIIPRIVPRDCEERPFGAPQSFHQYFVGPRVFRRALQFTEHLLQLLSMTGSRAIIRDRINRA